MWFSACHDTSHCHIAVQPRWGRLRGAGGERCLDRLQRRLVRDLRKFVEKVRLGRLANDAGDVLVLSWLAGPARTSSLTASFIPIPRSRLSRRDRRQPDERILGEPAYLEVSRAGSPGRILSGEGAHFPGACTPPHNGALVFGERLGKTGARSLSRSTNVGTRRDDMREDA